MTPSHLPLPQPPRWLTWSSGALWLGLVILGASVGSIDSFVGRFGKTLVETAAPIAFAVAGGSALLAAWQRREWRRQTQFIAFAAFEHALNAIARVAAELHTILAIAFSETDRDTRLSIKEAFRLPFGHAQQSVWTDALTPVNALVKQLIDDDVRAHEQMRRHQNAAVSASWAAGDESLRAADEMLAELRQDPKLADLFPERVRLNLPGGAISAEDAPEGVAASSEVPPEMVRALLEGAREHANSIVDAVDEMNARAVEASGFADRRALPLVTRSLELRVAALAVVAASRKFGDELDDETDPAAQYARETSLARILASDGFVALARCWQVLGELGAVFEDLQRDARRRMPDELREIQARDELVSALIDRSVALRVDSAQLRRKLRE